MFMSCIIEFIRLTSIILLYFTSCVSHEDPFCTLLLSHTRVPPPLKPRCTFYTQSDEKSTIERWKVTIKKVKKGLMLAFFLSMGVENVVWEQPRGA